MQQRDIIQDQIEQLGRVLGKLIANFFSLKTTREVRSAIEITNTQLKSQLGIDIENLLSLSFLEKEAYIKSKHLTAEHLDKLAIYFYEIGNAKDASLEKEDRLRWFTAAKEMIDLVEKYSNIFTFERMNLKDEIDKELA